MSIRTLSVLVAALATALLSACASPGYSPPPERRGDNRCPVGEVWVCEDRYPSRIEREDKIETFCRCQDPIHIR